MATHGAERVHGCSAALAVLCLALLVYPARAHAGDPAPVPPDVDPTLFSQNADYIFHMDTQIGSPDYYPLFKGLQDLFAIDQQPGGPVGNPGGYHWGYVQLGFKQPHFSGDRDVYIYDCNVGDGDCDNGLARFSGIWLPAPSYINRSGPCTRAVLGHELFHHVEYAYIEPVFPTAGGCGGTWGKFACEGQARAMQDKIYTDLDVNAALSCTAGFLGEVNNYLDDTTLALWQSSYKGALFWTYLMEQYGANPLEPTFGADFIRQFWEEAEDLGESVSTYQAIGNAIAHFGSDDSVESAFHSFVLANYIKDLDLTGTSQAFRRKYSYRDGNAVDFDSVSLFNLTYPMEGETEVYHLTAPWWGARYDRFDFRYCPGGSTIQIHFLPILANDPIGLGLIVNPKLMMGVVVERDGRPQLYYRKRAAGWVLQFNQTFDPYDQVIVTHTGVYGDVDTFVLASCIPAPPLPQFPLLNPLDPQTPGPPDVYTYGPIEPAFPPPPEPDQLPLSAIDPHLFEVYVGGLPARVLGGAPTRRGMRLQVEFPPQPGPGAYDVRVVLGDLDTTIPGGIVHGPRAPDVLALVDLSASMNLPPDLTKLQAARFAGHLFTDSLMETGQLGLVGFAGNDAEPDDDASVRLGLGTLDAAQRGRMHVALDNLVALPGALTSVGDGLAAALAQLDTAGAAATEHHLVLLLDGGENEAAFWADLADAVADSGVTIHAIAQGGLSDQALAAEIADASGGQYHFADDLPPEADAVTLARAYLSVADEVERRRSFLDQALTVGAAETVTVSMNSAPAPGQSPSPSTVAVFVDPGGPPLTALLASLLLEANGSPIVHGVDGNEVLAGAHYVVFRIADFKAGGWDLTLTGASALPAATDIELHASVHRPGQANVEAITIVCESIQRVGLAGPEGLGGCGGSAAGSGASLLPEVGDQVLVGFLPGDPTGAPDRPVITGRVYNAADGSTHELEFLANEGAEEFTGQGSGFLSAPFRATSHGSPAGIPDDPPPPRQVGSYNLRVEAGAPPGPSLAGLGPNLDVDVEAVSILRRSFHVLEAGGGTPDRDGDSLPDRYEDRYECLDGGAGDALADGDGDTLTNAAELAAGTHPCTADTDEGGEQDGSEVRGGRNPLDPGDDALPRVPGAYVLQQGFEHEDIDLWEPGTLPIMYDGHARFSDIVLKRGTIGRATPAWDTVVFNPKLHPGVYLDRGLTPGEEYCYQLYGVDSAGNEGAPTPVFCATAKNDPEPPLGDLRLEDAAPSSDAAMLTATLDLYNKEPSTTEMSIGIDTHPDSAWVPYLNEFPVDPGPYAGPWPRTVQVYAALRDAEGGVSEIYTDTILLWPPGSLGGIVGLVQAAPGGTPLGGAYVEVLAPAGASPDTADAGGGFGLDELEPGSYTLKFSYPGFLPLTVAGVQVLAGETTDLGVVLLGPGIFADGFE